MAFQSALADARELIQQGCRSTELICKGYVLVSLPGAVRVETGVPYEETKEGTYYPIWVRCIWAGYKDHVARGAPVPEARRAAVVALSRTCGDPAEQVVLAADVLLSRTERHLRAAAKAWLNKHE